MKVLIDADFFHPTRLKNSSYTCEVVAVSTHEWCESKDTVITFAHDLRGELEYEVIITGSRFYKGLEV